MSQKIGNDEGCVTGGIVMVESDRVFEVSSHAPLRICKSSVIIPCTWNMNILSVGDLLDVNSTIGMQNFAHKIHVFVGSGRRWASKSGFVDDLVPALLERLVPSPELYPWNAVVLESLSKRLECFGSVLSKPYIILECIYLYKRTPHRACYKVEKHTSHEGASFPSDCSSELSTGRIGRLIPHHIYPTTMDSRVMRITFIMDHVYIICLILLLYVYEHKNLLS